MIHLHWILLQKEDVTHYLLADQLNMLLSAGTNSTSDTLTSIIHDICAYIQNRIPETLWPNPMAHNHLPDACKNAACALVIEAIQSRIPVLKLSEAQWRNAEQARKTLEELYAYWQKECDPKRFESRMEAVRYRIRESNHKTLKGL